MSKRTEQVSANLQKIIGEIFASHLEWPQDTMATISRLDVPGDLKRTTVYVSVLPYEKSEEVIEWLNSQRVLIQQLMIKKLSMKFSPKLKFKIEHSTEYADRIDRILYEDQ